MEQLEQDDGNEIFQECDNDFLTKEECNLKKCELEEDQNFSYTHRTKHNQHVVHVGIIVVLLTICLGLTKVPKCLVNCVENKSINEKVEENKKDILNYFQQTDNFRSTHILERLLEYKDICKDLEIFTKDVKQKQEAVVQNKEEKSSLSNEIDINNNLIDIEDNSSGDIEEDHNIDLEYNSGSGSSGEGDCAKIKPLKNQKSKYSIKTANNKNGFNKHNKSIKAKNQKLQKKELNLNKKNSTAEPIIYLFALVFIYLLLKAASDINQHYKSQNKNDKRLRRCSLQSYAQSHRPDRRASKELALKQKQQQLQQRVKSLTRCSNQDQPNFHYRHQYQQQSQAHHLMYGSAQKSSEQKQQTTPGTPVHPNISYSGNWQLLRQHTTTQSLDYSDLIKASGGNEEILTSRMARRCSVPAALCFQRPKISTDPINLNVCLSRRTSIVASSLPLALEPNESLITETKRRVRMINRH